MRFDLNSNTGPISSTARTCDGGGVVVEVVDADFVVVAVVVGGGSGVMSNATARSS